MSGHRGQPRPLKFQRWSLSADKRRREATGIFQIHKHGIFASEMIVSHTLGSYEDTKGSGEVSCVESCMKDE